MDKNEKFKRQIAAIEKVRKAVNEQKAQGQKKPILDEFVLDIQSQGEYENKNADTKAAIVQEYMPSGDLFSYLYGDMPLSPESKWEVFYSLIEGTKHLHDIGIFLRDIKEENFLLNRDSIKVGDFDLACFKEDSEKEKTMLHGTLPFLSVAYLNRELKDALDLQDVWALGLIFYKMITVKNFVWLEAQTATEMIKLIKENCSSQEQIDKWFDKEVKEDSAGQLIYQMLTADHTKRPALESILRQITENKEDIKKSFLTLAIKLGYDKT
jgi:serine/threonine protein kinase